MLKDRVAGGVFQESGRELTLRTQVEWASRKVNDWFRRAAERAWGKVAGPARSLGLGEWPNRVKSGRRSGLCTPISSWHWQAVNASSQLERIRAVTFMLCIFSWQQ